MTHNEIFQVLRYGIQVKSGMSVFSCVKEMAALRSLLFPTVPSVSLVPVNPRVITPLPINIIPKEILISPVYRPRKNSSSGSIDRYAPYRLLWVKVIIRAAYDYALWKDSKDIRHRKFAEDAGKWLFDSSDLENSLSHLCELWNLPLEKIRHFAKNLSKEDVKKLEFKERQGRDPAQGILSEKVVRAE